MNKHWTIKTLFDFSEHEKFRRAQRREEETKDSWLYSEVDYFQALRKLRGLRKGKTYTYKLFYFKEMGTEYLRINRYRTKDFKAE